jgi:hypothetical protein
VREISILPNVTGTGRTIAVRQKLQTLAAPPVGSYLIGSTLPTSMSLEDILTAFSLEVPALIPAEMRLAYEKYLGSDEIDWSLALGPRGLAREVKRFREEVIDVVDEAESTGYAETLIRGRRIFDLLTPVRVDSVKVRSLVEAGEPLDSFLPLKSSECERIRYTHGTKTGRLRVESGPKVLTMPKQHRKVLTSKYPGGKIVSVDFISLEPRLALFTVGKSARGDVYDEISRVSGEPRAKTKIATLSFLYGAGASDGVSEKLRRHVRDFFNVRELHKRIEGSGGRNGYGRPLEVDEERLLIPHWVQSTAVDVCLLAFSDLAERLSGIADPLFLVHDAMFLDVPAENTERLSEIISEGVMVSPYGLFPLSLNGLESHE